MRTTSTRMMVVASADTALSRESVLCMLFGVIRDELKECKKDDEQQDSVLPDGSCHVPQLLALTCTVTVTFAILDPFFEIRSGIVDRQICNGRRKYEEKPNTTFLSCRDHVQCTTFTIHDLRRSVVAHFS